MSTEILMPALSPTMEEGKLAKWLVKEGDEVRSGDILAEIETDKATMEFEAVDEGRIGKILVPAGTEGVKVNQPIATLVGDESEVSSPPPERGRKEREALREGAAEAPPTPPSRPASSGTLPLAGGGEDRLLASPLARRLAAQAGIDIASLHGSGPRGRIVKSDIEAASKSGSAPKPAAKAPAAPSKPAPAGLSGVAPLPDARLFYKPEEYEAIPHDSMRKSIARRLTSAMALIPHFYLTIDCNIDRLMEARARLNAAAPKGDKTYKLSVNDFIVKASALALIRVPEVNASWTDDAILRHSHADIGVAVALDFGLITPIVAHAEGKGLAAISNEVKSLAERARKKALKPNEYEGGSFAISNLGMFGIKEFTAVINPPHAAILAVGAGEERAIAKAGKIEAATMMTVTLSCDHRVIDGATGSRFLQVFKPYIEDPAAMLL